MGKTKYKLGFYKILFGLFLILLCLPAIQMTTNIFDVKPLKGAIINSKKPESRINNWFNTTFQDSLENYTNDFIGFRPFFIRTRNQIYYSFFGEAKARGVIQGKDNFLYELNYIKAYNGLDFVGADSISNTVNRILSANQYLDSLNKKLVICLAAGKGSFYPENFPEKYQGVKTDSTNYKFYTRELKNAGLNVIDFNDWFLKMKDTSQYMLYPWYGIHWSHYGMLLAADSLIRYMEAIKNVNMPNIKIDKYKLSSKLKHTDYDIADGMNLLFQMESAPMCYPKFHWTKDTNQVKPKVLAITDSFYWGMYNIGIAKNAFSLGEFWFYYNDIHPNNTGNTTRVSQRNLKEEIAKNDIILIIATEATLPRIGWGFFEDSLFTKKTTNNQEN